MYKNNTQEIYNGSLSLLTDFYQMTMAYAYWKMNLKDKESVFLLSFRKIPFQGGFTVAAGLESVIHYLNRFRFEASDLAYLETLLGNDEKPYFCRGFLDYLADLRFTGCVDAMAEGTIAFPQEPLIRIQGPLIQCQLLESPLLNLVNFPTLIATKAARICLAAQGEPVLEFGLRRAQGIDGALTASRAAYIGGCDSTSNLMAGKLFGIPVKGTHSHSWIMVFDEELEAFKAYAKALPNNCIFLVDTYHTIEGVKNAIEVGKWLREEGKEMIGIRLDSGDLADLSFKSRKMLDEAGFQDAKILASNDLDETIISELKRQGAKINIWGVGTSLVTAKGQSALDGVYKLSAIRDPGGPWKYKVKLSEQALKISNPGLLQVKRFYTEKKSEKKYVADLICESENMPLDDFCFVDSYDTTNEHLLDKNLFHQDLLIPIFRNGRSVYQVPLLSKVKEYTRQELSRFPIGIKRFLNPHLYPVGMEKSLYQCKMELIKGLRTLGNKK